MQRMYIFQCFWWVSSQFFDANPVFPPRPCCTISAMPCPMHRRRGGNGKWNHSALHFDYVHPFIEPPTSNHSTGSPYFPATHANIFPPRESTESTDSVETAPSQFSRSLACGPSWHTLLFTLSWSWNFISQTGIHPYYIYICFIYNVFHGFSSIATFLFRIDP